MIAWLARRRRRIAELEAKIAELVKMLDRNGQHLGRGVGLYYAAKAYRNACQNCEPLEGPMKRLDTAIADFGRHYEGGRP